jgi:hypothetical protein
MAGGKFAPYIDQRYSMAVTPRPRDLVTSGYGVYALSTTTGEVAAGISAASEIVQFRWVPSDTNVIARVYKVQIGAASRGTGFTAGEGLFSMKIARTWTAAGTGGGTATITGDNGKLRDDMGTTRLASLRTATTAALGAGTKTFDSQPLTEIVCGVSNATYTQFVGSGGNLVTLFDAQPGTEPLTLENEEGFSILCTVPAAGVWKATFHVEWSEMLVSQV